MVQNEDEKHFIESFILDLTSLSHDGVYLLDSDLVVYLQENVNVHWIDWFQEHIQLGHCCFVTPAVLAEIEGDLPIGIHLLSDFEHETPTTWSISASITDLAGRLSLSDGQKMKLVNNISILIEASNLSVTSTDILVYLSNITLAITYDQHTNISLDDLLQGKIALLSANMELLRHILGNEEKRNIVEDVFNLYGHEHLMSVIGVHQDKYQCFE